MHILRLITRQLTLLLFGVLLVAFPAVTAFTLEFGTPDQIKKTAQDSGLYGVFVDGVLNESANVSNDRNAQNVLKDPNVQQIAKGAFTPGVLQNASEEVINGFYDWLNQKTSSPQFTIDFTKPRQQFVSGLSDYAQKRASSLPRCTVAQLQQLNNTEDILSIPCLPPGVDATKAAQQFSQDAVKNADFLNDPVITAKDLPKDEQGRTIAEQPSNLPAQFSSFKGLPWVLGGMLIVLALCIVLLHENRAAGTRRVAWSLIGTGILLVIALLIYTATLKNFAQNTLNIDDPAFRSAAARAITDLLHAYLRYVGIVGGFYIGIGAVLILLQSRLAPLEAPIGTVNESPKEAQPSSVDAASDKEELSTTDNKETK